MQIFYEGTNTSATIQLYRLIHRRRASAFCTKNADIFVCTHLQGDPSCIYLETMACGVPIVGYANDAWKSLSAMSVTGWNSPLKDPKLLSVKIAELNNDRISISAAGHSAREFAKQHLFNHTMDQRVGHLVSCLSDEYLCIQQKQKGKKLHKMSLYPVKNDLKKKALNVILIVLSGIGI